MRFFTSGFTGNVLADILSGLIGAGILAAITSLLRIAYQRKIERRFPIAGEYLTSYEDRDDSGVVIKKKATASLAQKGHSITGKTYNLDDQRSWNLRMVVERDRYLIGTYTSSQRSDSSLGVIFLDRQGDPDKMSGLWAGYDPYSNRIETGQYSFVRFSPPRIGLLSEIHSQEATALLARELGDHYLTERDLLEYAQKDQAFALVATDGQNRSIAVCLAELLKPDDFDARFGEHADEICRQIPGFSHQTIGFFKSIAVTAKMKGRGIGTALLQRSLDWLEQKRATIVIALAWEAGGVCFAKGILESVGFQPIAHIENFWYQDSVEKGYQCPTCGNPCRCAANVYLRSN